MNLAQFPRRRYTAGQTPLEELPRLTKMFGPSIYMKRDDLLGLAGGGSCSLITRHMACSPIASNWARLKGAVPVSNS